MESMVPSLATTLVYWDYIVLFAWHNSYVSLDNLSLYRNASLIILWWKYTTVHQYNTTQVGCHNTTFSGWRVYITCRRCRVGTRSWLVRSSHCWSPAPCVGLAATCGEPDMSGSHWSSAASASWICGSAAATF